MAQETDSLLKKGGDVLREIASHQGAAYRQYGEALEKFGTGEMNAGELLKTAGDLYFREVGRIGAGLFEASTEAISRALGGTGLAPDEAKAKNPKVAPKR
jgi:hypothetical protein